jgi:hypothetical protein
MKLAATLGLALGVATTVGGCLAFAFGMNASDTIIVSGFGPLDGLWAPDDYCFLGTVLTAVGAGLTTFGLVWVVLFFRHGQPVLPRRRWLVWSLVLMIGAAGVGLGAMSLRSQRGPKLSPADADAARAQAIEFLTAPDTEKAVATMTTPEYQQRERTQKQSVTYKVARAKTTMTTLHATGQVHVAGVLTAVGKTTAQRMEGGKLVGAGAVVLQFPAPKEIGFEARLTKSENGVWLIDEMTFQEP